MTENLLTQSVIKLFGRLLQDMQFVYDPKTVVRGFDNFLQKQLAGGSGSGKPITTTVKITTSVVFKATTSANDDVLSKELTDVSSLDGLESGMKVSAKNNEDDVFNPDTTISIVSEKKSNYTLCLKVDKAPLQAAADVDVTAILTKTSTYVQAPHLARIYGFSFEGTYYGLPRPSIFLVHGTGKPIGNWEINSTMEESGVLAREWDFSGRTRPSDLACWEYEKGDFSIRLDAEAGQFEQILLVAALRAGADMADRATPRSGASLAGASLSGASLSGASLSGASLSGASLSGASLSGASLRGR
jgi:hypothetical protein